MIHGRQVRRGADACAVEAVEGLRSARQTEQAAMRQCPWRALGMFMVLALLLSIAYPALVSAQEDPRAHLSSLINQVRLGQGLAPLGTSTLLSQAAQRHAEDLVGVGTATHEGSDGSTYQQRIREARYHAWNDGLLVNEIVWIGLGTAEDAVAWFASNAEGQLLADPRYREMGIGYADDGGVHYFVVNLGSRPGVIPVFVNDDAATTDSPMVAMRLTNEEAVPMGEGAWIGRAIEVRLSNTPDFEGMDWQPWEPLLPWLLAGEEPGEYEVYVEFRDGANRTAVAQDTIRLVLPGEVLPTPAPALGVLMPTSTPDVQAPAAEGEMPAPESPEPTAFVATPATEAVQATAAPADDPDLLVPFPTWTPLPEDGPATIEAEATDWPLLAAFGLQALALLLGLAAFLRRR